MKVKICGIDYIVNECDNNFTANAISFGEVDYKKGVILLNNELSDDIKSETLCHEILHAMLVYIGRSDLSEDETFVCSLGNAINQTFEVKHD